MTCGSCVLALLLLHRRSRRTLLLHRLPVLPPEVTLDQLHGPCLCCVCVHVGGRGGGRLPWKVRSTILCRARRLRRVLLH